MENFDRDNDRKILCDAFCAISIEQAWLYTGTLGLRDRCVSHS